uniref:Methyltranfer_dom domain-containing protein n=1 Tax=Elaeophora elaphi TaxID=1147741 RepID=A0A0R3RVV1_9BILA
MEDFSQRLLEILNNGMLSVGLIMGHELQLFDALAAVSSENDPATCTMIAEKADMRERYVREWLCLMACGKIIEVDESGEKFWIKEGRIGDLCVDKSNVLLVIQRCVLMCAKAYPAVIELFRKDGPLGGMENKMFDEFDKTMASISEAAHRENIISKFVPATEMQDRLKEGGIQVLDVGCGRGMHIAELGSHYPKCLFTGIDLSLDAIIGANKKRDETNAGLDNVSYMQMNGEVMKDEWTGKFDWVIMFDACHDQVRPDRCLKEIYRVLKPDGLFSMFETDGTGNVYKDKDMEISTYMYGVSLFHCLPVGMNSEDAMGLGAMWGCEKAKQLLSDAGFEKVEIRPIPFSKFCSNVLYLCRK